MFDTHDTIAAPATASGGAVAMIRISGPEAIAVCDRIFRGSARLADTPRIHRTLRPHHGRRPHGGRSASPPSSRPRSYTGEDSVELLLPRLLLRRGRDSAPAPRRGSPHRRTRRIHRPGVSRRQDGPRAGRGGRRPDCLVVARIPCPSPRPRCAADSPTTCTHCATVLLHLASLLELELDFSEEDVEFADRTQLRGVMEEIGAELDTLCRSFSLGNALKQGVGVAIVGAPNAGKSTLLNRLLGEERAMVSDIAGTTRDAIEETLDIDGVLFRFIDTAGLRRTDDRLERMGIERTLAAAARARIILRVTDAADDAAASPPCCPRSATTSA